MFKVRLPVTCTISHVGKQLANGVKLIVVEDKTCTKPAAAMTFGVGKNNDPAEFPGLAHFCEHMLFMGTEKYPSEDAYQTAVKRNGGSCNAFTSNEVTSYHFTSSLDAYKAIVDMFLEFFIAPAFNVSAVDRELNAVNSEDERNHTIDGRRIEEMMKTFVVPEHPRHRYGSGNMTTLKTDPEAKGLSVHDALRTFFAKYYVAESSCLVLYSPYPAEEMMAMVEPTLLRLKTGDVPPSSFVPRGEVMLPNTAGRWCNVLTTTKQRSIKLKWPVPFGTNDSLASPMEYISHMVGHEVAGTILASLRAKGLASALSSGNSAFDGENGDFEVSITLTDKGVANLVGVIDVVYDYIELLRRVGPSSPEARRTFDEMRLEQRTRFEYSEVKAPSSHCSNLSCNSVRYDGELAFAGSRLAEGASLEACFAALDLLTAERGIIIFANGDEAGFATAAASNPFAGDTSSGLPHTTRFHKMRYSVCDMPREMISRWSKEAMGAKAALDPLLAMPAANPFLSSDFTVYGPPNPTNVPERVDTKYGYALIKRNEVHLQQPKMYAHLNLMLATIAAAPPTVANRYYREVMVRVIDEALIDTLYFASLAGLSMEVSSAPCGILLRAEGPSMAVPPSLVALLEQVLDVKGMQQTVDVFTRHHEKKHLSLKTVSEGQPSDLGFAEYHNYYASEHTYSWQDLLGFAPTANYEGYCAYVASLFGECRTELIVDGNMASTEAIMGQLVGRVDEVLGAKGYTGAPPTAFPQSQDFFVPNAITTTTSTADASKPTPSLYLINLPPFSATNVNVAVSVRLAMGPATTDRSPLLKVLANIIASPFFNTLRSTETLGYAVHAQLTRTADRQATMVFSVQSPVAPPLYLYSRIHAFIEAFGGQVLANLKDSDVEGAVKGIIQSLKQRTMSVADDGRRIASDRHNPNGYDWRKEEIARLEQGVTKADLVAIYEDYIAHGGKMRKGVAVFVHSSKLPEAAAEGEVIDYTDCALPSMRQAAPAAPTTATTGSVAVKDTAILMNTFDAANGGVPTRVAFRLLGSKADAHGTATLVAVPNL